MNRNTSLVISIVVLVIVIALAIGWAITPNRAPKSTVSAQAERPNGNSQEPIAVRVPQGTTRVTRGLKGFVEATHPDKVNGFRAQGDLDLRPLKLSCKIEPAEGQKIDTAFSVKESAPDSRRCSAILVVGNPPYSYGVHVEATERTADETDVMADLHITDASGQTIDEESVRRDVDHLKVLEKFLLIIDVAVE